jgi:hypothetical protein
MALGIKKITESVVEEERSLTMLGKLTSDKSKVNFDDNKAVPVGAVISDANVTSGSGTLRIKSGENVQVKINAHTSIASKSITKTEIGDYQVINLHLNKPDAKDADRSVANHNIRDNAITTPKIINNAVTTAKIINNAVTTPKIEDSAVITAKIKDSAVVTNKIADKAVTNAKLDLNSVTTDRIVANNVTRDKLSASLRAELDGLRADITDLQADLKEFKKQVENDFKLLRSEMNTKLSELESKMKTHVESVINQYNLKNAVIHHNYDIVGNKADGKYTSTPLSDISCSGNITCSGDINGKRVFFMTYQDLAEAYIPGEYLEPGDIVALHEDGKVYKAESMKQCIVGVISNEYANCFGATKEELFNGSKVAVGMIGKVHVKVKGPVKLGQKITVSLSDSGVGMGWNYTEECIGKALESYDCDFDEVHEILVQIRPM